MDKDKLFNLLVVVVVVVVGFAAYQRASFRAEREISRIRADSAALHTQLDAVRAEVALRDSLKAAIRGVETTLRGEAVVLRDSIRAEEVRRQAAQLAVWNLRSTDAREVAFQEAFPQFAPTMRVTEYQRSPDELSVRYLMVPFGAASTFVTYKIRSDSYMEQNALFAVLDSVNLQVISLKDSVEVLNQLNQNALRMGMDTAFSCYGAITQEYIRELERPAFSVNVPSKWYLIGGTAAGFVLGTVIR